MIRSPHLHEAEALADLHLRTWEETYGGRFPASAWGDEAREQRRRMWRSICAEPDRPGFRVAVAERDGQLIGFGGARPNQDAPPPRPRQLHFLYLLASGQGCGFGQALLDAVLGDEPASL
ncbi:GNAT family N-acetyltransferase [Clavibacter michiganensis subsp. phaseoli]|uniref:GNAT family N-acetyltransferase n=1 Tax=Clavibacter phaseoli TaxID=1734031 RepID=UPI001FB3C014|nr:GNAT family N-acetyltransferase [Clavibacter phaseoli]MCJ1709632.1 GNAT family N-acetyltransferase [Clavibacter phaseoli]